MKLKTLEKLFEYIDFLNNFQGNWRGKSEIQSELRALVKAESDSAMAEKAMSDYREGRALDKIYEPEGGDAHMPSRPLDGKLNTPSDVQAEGRGEAEDRIEFLEWIISQVLNDLPRKRNWLNPELEKSMRYVVDTMARTSLHDPDNLPHDGNAEQLAQKRKEAGK